MDESSAKGTTPHKIESSVLPSQKHTDFGMNALSDTFGMNVPSTAVKFQN
jgi:hypothetical protein